jgi:hypothetical protein
LLAVALAACATKTEVESDLGLSDAPDWVNEGTNTLNNRDGRLFHGVGQAPTMGDEALQIATADGRARAEVARIFSSYMDIVGQDYLSATGAGKDADAQQSVSQQIRNLTKVNLAGARIIAHWRDEKTQTIYSLAELDMNHVKQTAAAADNMNEDLRRYVSTQGDNIFDRIEQ